MNKIFHPNIDELYVSLPRRVTNHLTAHSYRSGSVCLDVINQTWSPMFGMSGRVLHARTVSSASYYCASLDMINIFEVFLPQLLRYPNPNDPLNGEAAALLMRHPKEYEIKVKGKFQLR